jgi:hypothetical protein
MRPLSIILGVFISVAPVLVKSAQQAYDWKQAAREIHRLTPRAFPNLPAEVISELERRRCTIPQVYGDSRPHNVIEGSFAKKGQVDWAVLCSTGGDSSILIFWGGSARRTSAIATEPDINQLQYIGNGKIGYSRYISKADNKYMADHCQAIEGEPPIDHEGIDDALVEKGSVVHYYHNGKWLRLPGSD